VTTATATTAAEALKSVCVDPKIWVEANPTDALRIAGLTSGKWSGKDLEAAKAVREYAKDPDNHSGYLADVGAAKDFVDLHWSEISR